MFITFEGIDGAGTTTHSRLLASWLEGLGIDVHLTAEPSKGVIGKLIRMALKNETEFETDSILMSYLFAADRREHILREIEPAIEQGKWVVCDRYHHSTIAYQGVEVSENWLECLLKPLKMPDVVVFLEIDVESAMQRLNIRLTGKDTYESKGFLQKVYDRYMNIFDDKGSYLLIWQSTDAPMDAVQEEIRKKILPLVEKHLSENGGV